MTIKKTSTSKENWNPGINELKSLFDSNRDAIFFMRGVTVVDCNPATLKIFGCRKSDIIGKAIFDFFPEKQSNGKDSMVLAGKIMDHVRDGNPQIFEWEHVRKDRTPFSSRVMIAMSRDEQGKELFKVFVRDSTHDNSIRRENERLAMLANTTTNMVILTDKDRKIEWVNPAFTKITGYEQSEVLGKSPGELLQGPGTDPEVVKYMSEKLKSGEGFKDVEVINYTKKGIPYWISIEINPVKDEQGEILNFIAIESDITERKLARQALAESEVRSRILIDQSPIGVIEWDLEFNVREWNKAAEQIFGYSREEAIGKNAEFILSEEVRSHVAQVWKALTSMKGGERSSNMNVTKSGENIMCEWYNNTLIDENNELVGVVSMVEDVTERLRSEETLRQNEIRFRQIVKSSPMGIFMYEIREDGKLYLIEVNRAANEILGMDCTQLLGLEITKAFPGLLNTEIPKYFKRAALKGIPWFTEDVHYNEGEISGIYEVNAFQAGNQRMVVMFLDVTERKKSEQAIKKKNEELIKINQELDRFVYSASHDLRAPIASLLGSIEVIRKENDPEGLHKLLKMQEKSLARMDDFIRDIVNYSRNTRLDVEVETIDFEREVRDTFEQLHFMENLDKIDQQFSFHTNSGFYTDPKRLKVILNNLISNSIKYADMTKEKPFIRTEVEVKGGSATIRVSDNGVGIEPKLVDNIFGMFFRASARSTGSGLGLYIVKEVIQRLGGSIKVKSKLHVGSEFIIDLPSLNPKEK